MTRRAAGVRRCDRCHRIAHHWYWVAEGAPLFVSLDIPRPNRYAVPYCGACKTAVWQRFEESAGIVSK